MGFAMKKSGKLHRWAVMGPLLLAIGCARLSEAPPEPLPDDATLRAGLARCCAGADTYPLPVVQVVESAASSIVPVSRAIMVRAPYLQDQPGARARLLDGAQPLDMVLIANRAHLSGAVGVGYFGHSLLTVGDEAQLRALGVWDDPAVVPFHDRIRAGGLAIEAIEGGVHLANADQVMDSDASALLRPFGLSTARKRAAIVALFREIGKPFDVHFDLATEEALFCTELIDRVLPEANLPITTAYGRKVIWPDEVAAASLLGRTGFRLQTYVEGSPTGWREAGWQEMAVKMLAAWQ